MFWRFKLFCSRHCSAKSPCAQFWSARPESLQRWAGGKHWKLWFALGSWDSLCKELSASNYQLAVHMLLAVISNSFRAPRKSSNCIWPNRRKPIPTWHAIPLFQPSIQSRIAIYCRCIPGYHALLWAIQVQLLAMDTHVTVPARQRYIAATRIAHGFTALWTLASCSALCTSFRAHLCRRTRSAWWPIEVWIVRSVVAGCASDSFSKESWEAPTHLVWQEIGAKAKQVGWCRVQAKAPIAWRKRRCCAASNKECGKPDPLADHKAEDMLQDWLWQW